MDAEGGGFLLERSITGSRQAKVGGRDRWFAARIGIMERAAQGLLQMWRGQYGGAQRSNLDLLAVNEMLCGVLRPRLIALPKTIVQHDGSAEYDPITFC